MKALRWLGIFLLISAALPGIALAQTWSHLNHTAPFNAGSAVLLTDGRVLVHSEQDSSQNWYTLTPDNKGSYINGTWTQAGSMPSGYAPLYFGSVVLPDGRAVVEGGEYNNLSPVWTNLGAIYDPKTNAWTKVNPPSGWANIGDAQSVILADGTYMQADCCSILSAFFNPSNLTWSAAGISGKVDSFDEEGWTLLPNGNVLTVDCNQSDLNHSELYITQNNNWVSGGEVPVILADAGSHEIGPAVLRPDGTVFYSGASGHTAVYNSSTGAWTAGPDFGSGNDVADGPAALEINGKVIIMTSPGVFNTNSSFYEWDGTSLTKIPGPPNAPSDSSYYGHFVELPTGQLLFTDFSSDVEIFTPAGHANSAWAPVITGGSAVKLVNISRGQTYTLQGKQFNGLSQGAAYGDDYQSATNYPIVAIRNKATGHIFFAKSHDHSSMGVATGNTTVSTKFDVPSNTETGASQLFVIANGIRSNPASVTVQ
jgi:hypothetical protein